MLTFLPLEQIDEMDKWEGAQLNRAKEILAYELTSLVHGKEEAEKAQTTARALFAGGADSSDMPRAVVHVKGEISILDLMVQGGIAPSKSEARRLIIQGGVSLSDAKIDNPNRMLTPDELSNEPVLKKGKKNFYKIIVE